MVCEREAGTIEQLPMSPASTTEKIVANRSALLFSHPHDVRGHRSHPAGLRSSFRGSLLMLLGAGCLCILSGISIGTVIATFSRSAQQAQLTSFFVNPPLSALSGALKLVGLCPSGYSRSLCSTLSTTSHPSSAEARSREAASWRVWPNSGPAPLHHRSGLTQHHAIPQAT